MKHTKGPWTISNGGESQYLITGDKWPICTLDKPHFSQDATEKANARLIAAAPELLDGLKIAAKTLSEIAHPLYGTSSWEMERAAEKALILIISAIAKAEGEFK